MARHRAYWIAGIVGVLVLVVAAAAFFIDEPLRRSMEREVNRRLVGYHASIGTLRFHPIGFSVDLGNVTLVQDAHPDPPVADFPRISAGVEWRQLLRGRIVAHFLFDRPRLHVDLQHVKREAQSKVPISKRGWQNALAAIYPLKIDRFTVVDGDVVYLDVESKRVTSRPLRLQHLNLEARNIRNIISPDRVYPSPVHADAVVFDSGKLAIDGDADFLAEPYAGVKASLALEHVPLAAFRPVAEHAHLDVRKGVLAAEGEIEYAPQVKVVHLRRVVLDDFEGDFIHTQRGDATEQAMASTAEEAARTAANNPDMLVRVDVLTIRDGTFGFVNRAARASYRTFLSETKAEIRNFSNQRTEGTSTATLTGKFMGSGDTSVSATFRPERSGPDFNMRVAVNDTDMRTMNDLLRAYARFDVVSGVFSVYSELTVKDRAVNGYVKPLFRDVRAYSPEKDRGKSTLHKLYERAVTVASKILENRPRAEVATRADISGPLDNPKASTWEVVVKLVENAFFKAILPGFERQVTGRPSSVTERKDSRRGRS